MKILSIGNSFSQDAQAYLHALAAGEGVHLHTVNLYIGGCPLQRHWENVESGLPAYHYELNGKALWMDADCTVPKLAGIRQTLEETPWDVVTFQQASHDSGLYETYQPYLTDLSEYVRRCAPQAKQYIHQTWAYETDSTHAEFPRYHCDQSEMYRRLKDAYARAAESIGAEMLPSGDVIQTLRSLPEFDYANGGPSLCRDGFHMSLDCGRYAVAATWFAKLTGRRIGDKGFVPEAFTPERASLLPIIRNTVADIVGI